MKQNTYINCISGVLTRCTFKDGSLIAIDDLHGSVRNDVTGNANHVAGDDAVKKEESFFIAPGLTDLQVNGVNGVDFNNSLLTEQQIREAVNYLLSHGITTFLPTLISNSDENISVILKTISDACTSDPLVGACIGGIHLEGPFLSALEGAKGAHDETYLRLPDWDLIKRYQQIAGGRIRVITVAPELEGAKYFIEQCVRHNIIVSIGHSMANTAQINDAVAAGACLSTHLGNAVPLQLPRHPNILWDQLAHEKLYACIITDGLHVPDSFVKVVIKVKGDTTLLVSDATKFAGMAAGEYNNHIGGAVIVDAEKRVSLKRSPGLLAGAAKTLLEDVETLLDHNICSLQTAWKMGSVNVNNVLEKHNDQFRSGKDFVIFRQEGSKIMVSTVIKNGKIVFGNGDEK